jgi:hypothetical protein
LERFQRWNLKQKASFAFGAKLAIDEPAMIKLDLPVAKAEMEKEESTALTSAPVFHLALMALQPRTTWGLHRISHLL